ncbi:MAG: hypothetical protein IJQ93_05945 [Bacteroidales bacterium]|nr:hypothetical protein [Bacteroidales bacterium]
MDEDTKIIIFVAYGTRQTTEIRGERDFRLPAAAFGRDTAETRRQKMKK